MRVTRNYNNVRLQYIRSKFAAKYTKIAEEKIFSDNLNIQVTPEEGKLLGLFIQICKVQTIIEVGTLYGFSAMCMAYALPEDGHIYTIEKNPRHAEIARKNFTNFKLDSKITLLEGNAMDKLQELSPNVQFDMIFIDADKASYPRYLDWAELNIKPYGLIIGDNALLFDTVFKFRDSLAQEGVSERSWNGITEFNNRLSDSSRYYSIMIPSDSGMNVALKLT